MNTRSARYTNAFTRVLALLQLVVLRDLLISASIEVGFEVFRYPDAAIELFVTLDKIGVGH